MKKEKKNKKYLRDNSFRNCSISLLFSAYIVAKRFNSASTFSDAAWMVWYSFFSGAVNATKQQDTIVSYRLKQNKFVMRIVHQPRSSTTNDNAAAALGLPSTQHFSNSAANDGAIVSENTMSSIRSAITGLRVEGGSLTDEK